MIIPNNLDNLQPGDMTKYMEFQNRLWPSVRPFPTTVHRDAFGIWNGKYSPLDKKTIYCKLQLELNWACIDCQLSFH